LKSRSEVRNALVKVVPNIGDSHSTEELKPDAATALARFDQTKWKKAKLGDVCDEISVRIDNPASSGHARFVGLEHFDSGDLKIRRWGSTENLESAMKVFSSGDVLFARRNAYLKRASLADFDGVCSGDAIVLRERHEAIVPGFLAFLLNTNRFWEFAIANAAGTMSRRVNGKTLMRFEFDLPPLDQQRRIAEILWAVDEAMQSAINLKDSIAVARDAWLADRLEKTAKDRLVALRDVATSIRNGMVGKVAEHYVEKGITYLVSKNVRRNRLKLDEVSYVSEEFHSTHRKSQLQPFDILTVQSGHVGETCVVPPEFGVANCHALIISSPKLDVVDPYFIAFYLNSEIGQKQLRKLVIGSALQHINTSELQRVKLPLPPLDEQRAIADAMRSMDEQIAVCSVNFDSLVKLRDAFLSELT